MKQFLAALALLSLAACSPPAQAPGETATSTPPPPPSIEGLPAGAYVTDPLHSSLIVRLDHLGFVHFTARFTHWSGALQLDPAHPASASIGVNIEPQSIASDNAPEEFLATQRGPEFLDTAQFPKISFQSTAIELTGANTARITGDLTLHGVTKPVTLDATFNGGYAGHPMDPNARIGFSAHGVFKRSDFGISQGLPPPGSTMGVGDDVEVIVEAEFTGPAWTPPAQPAQP